MADKSKIEWTDATWNPITGCSVVSPGCTNCYAMKLAGGRLKHHPSRAGLTTDSKAGPVWNGQVRLNEQWLDQPRRWKRPRMIFVCAHGDLFHENVPDESIDRVFAVMALAPQHTFQVLTKRSARMRDYVTRSSGRVADTVIARRRAAGDNGAVVPLPHIRPGASWWPLPNVWLGVSAEDQARADERIPNLLATPAAVRFVSAEPLLGPVRLDRLDETTDTFADCGGHPDPHWPLDTQDATWFNALRGHFEAEARAPNGARRGDIEPSVWLDAGKIDWVIAGGESGAGARPMHPDWARSLRDQCQAANVPFFFKQWGDWAPAAGALEHPQSEDCPFGEFHSPSGDWIDSCICVEGRAAGGTMYRIGKALAGRRLDGRTWDELPKVEVQEGVYA